MKLSLNRPLACALVLGCMLVWEPIVAPRLLARQSDAVLAIVGARVYPSPQGIPIHDGTVVMSGGKIAAVGPHKDIAIPGGAKTIDGKGLIVTAGFQNSHVHFTEPLWLDAAHQLPDKLTLQLEAMLTRFGFTTVVDTASFLDNTNALRRRIQSGEVSGPRILSAGEAIYPPQGIPYYLRDAMPPEVLAFLPQPATGADAAALVVEHAAKGTELIKLFTGSWVERGRVLPMPDSIASAAVSEAHKHGLLVFTHPSNLAGLEVALGSGVDVLAHAVEDTRGMTPEHLARMKKQGMSLVPTLKLFGRDAYLWEILDEVRDYARSGGQILFGTDVGYLTDYDPSDEYRLMGTAGLSWREILQSLTTNPADRFKEGSRRGRVETGMDADLVVLGTDPVLDLRAFSDVRYTIRSGRVIYTSPPSH